MINFYELVKNDPQYYKQFCCKDLLFLNYDCPVKLKKMAKWSEHHYIYYVLSGKKTLHTTEASFTMTEGSIAFIKKGACIVEQFFDDVFCIVVFIIPDSFIVSFLNEYLAEEQPNGLSSQLVIPIYDDIRVRSFYQSIIPYFASDEIPDSILELKFKELLLNIIHNPDNAELRNYLLTIRSQEASPVKEIMEANYAYNLTLEAYAKLTNRSLSSFKRDFQSIYKTTPGRWLIEKKLVHAKRLLIQTNKSIADLAFESGFENTAHFSRLFKQKNGTTPIQYRKKASENQVLAI
jgi:AraC-like DNA-binding protein